MLDIDFKKLVTQTLPVRLRQPKHTAWLHGLIEPFRTVHKSFLDNREMNLYKVNHNSQVYSIEAVLNDKFDNTARRIYITDGLTKDRIYIYLPKEQKSAQLGKLYLYNKEDYADTGIEFIIWIPAALTLKNQDIIKMQAEVDFYKLAGKRYRIYTYE